MLQLHCHQEFVGLESIQRIQEYRAVVSAEMHARKIADAQLIAADRSDRAAI
jgi:hypothetical protein